MGRYVGIGCDAFEAAAHPTSDQPFGGEQSHLRVIGDHPQPTVSWCVLGDALGAEVVENLGSRHELDWCAECIADCATQQAAPKAPLGSVRLLALAAPGRWRY